MKALDLFSCIGSHALGLHRAGIATTAMCEIDPWRRSVLAARFPGVPIYEDVTTLPAESVAADIIIGGPPCQRTSVAAAIHGRRTGETLWPHMLRCVVACRPRWVVVEQPPGNQEWQASVCRSLSASGYHAFERELSARELGAPYLRRRLFVVACASVERLALARLAVTPAIDCVSRAANARGDWDARELETLPVDARTAGEMARPMSRWRRAAIEALGDSNPPHMAEVLGRAILAASTPS